MIRRVAQRRRLGGPDGGQGAGERGSVAAELAVALPAVVVVILLGVGALMAASTQVRLQDVAADAARLVARGEPEGRASGVVAQAVPGARAATSRRGDLVCVTASVDARVAGVPIPLRAASCALGGGL
ncbi:MULTISPECIES: TadE family type IV pilus minor pilin [unclassified Microbacterium]|uniref:TadE family type IV pilus minor pilin n=1 Tax=unclassified Microbacterium TaxID=2609290 RepID=UPI000B1CF100|nr:MULTISPECIES: TadE family type IV pilus minor pilin [unclassified Microbacterium]